MKMKTSAASENVIECSVTYDKTLFGMWSTKMKKSARPRKRSTRRSRPAWRLAAAFAPPYRSHRAPARSDDCLVPCIEHRAVDLAVGGRHDAEPAGRGPLRERSPQLYGRHSSGRPEFGALASAPQGACQPRTAALLGVIGGSRGA